MGGPRMADSGRDTPGYRAPGPERGTAINGHGPREAFGPATQEARPLAAPGTRHEGHQSPPPAEVTQRHASTESPRDRRNPVTGPSAPPPVAAGGDTPAPAPPTAPRVSAPGQGDLHHPILKERDRTVQQSGMRVPRSREEGAMPAELRDGDAGQPRPEAAITAAQRNDAARPVSVQILTAASQLGERPVEITLSPEELGRVRLTLSGSAETGMTVHVQAERAETIELLRRHANELADQLMKLGYASVAFGFAGQDDHAAGGRGEDVPSPPPDIAAEDVPARPDLTGAAKPARDTGLDLRL